jgi:hypothetical protein
LPPLKLNWEPAAPLALKPLTTKLPAPKTRPAPAATAALPPNPLISHADRKGPETVGSILPEVVWTLDFGKLQ